MAVKKSRKKESAPKGLLLVDHDGTLCNSNHNAYESLKSAAYMTLNFMGFNSIDINGVDWNKIFSETSGTTELYYAKRLCHEFSIPRDKQDIFSNFLFKNRANWYTNSKSNGDYVWDTYYPDTEELIAKAKNSNFSVQLVTGNPSLVIKERLPERIKLYFKSNTGEIEGTFGEEAETRADLILLAIKRFLQKHPNFKLKRNSEEYIENVIYVADSRSDLFSGIEAKMKTIWIPSRELIKVYEAKSQDFVKFMSETIGKSIFITNALDSREVYEFIGLDE